MTTILIVAGILVWLYGIRVTFRWCVEEDFLKQGKVPSGQAIGSLLLLSLFGSLIGLVVMPFRALHGGDDDARLRLVKTLGGESRQMRMHRLEQEAADAKKRTAELERELEV